MKQLLVLLIIILISILASCSNQKTYNNNYSSTKMAAIPIIAKAAKLGKQFFDKSVRRKSLNEARKTRKSRNHFSPNDRRQLNGRFVKPPKPPKVQELPKKKFLGTFFKKPDLSKTPIAHLFKAKSGLIILSIMGSIGFTSFVLEEAEQTCMFGNFTLSKPPRYSKKPVIDKFSEMSVQAIKHCFRIHHAANYFNNTIGYLYPFGFAYRTYQDANELYLCSQLYKSLQQMHQTFYQAGDLGDTCISLYKKEGI